MEQRTDKVTELSQLSDFELNKGIAEFVHVCFSYTTSEQKVFELDPECWDDEDYQGNELDYCNNWNDLMPLVVEHTLKIDTMARGKCADKHFLVRAVNMSNDKSFTTSASTLNGH